MFMTNAEFFLAVVCYLLAVWCFHLILRLHDLQDCIARHLDAAVQKEREACCGPDVTNRAGICAADMPHVVVQKYCAAIRARNNHD